MYGTTVVTPSAMERSQHAASPGNVASARVCSFYREGDAYEHESIAGHLGCQVEATAMSGFRQERVVFLDPHVFFSVLRLRRTLLFSCRGRMESLFFLLLFFVRVLRGDVVVFFFPFLACCNNNDIAIVMLARRVASMY